MLFISGFIELYIDAGEKKVLDKMGKVLYQQRLALKLCIIKSLRMSFAVFCCFELTAGQLYVLDFTLQYNIS